MDLTPSPQEETYRNEARAWLEANVPELEVFRMTSAKAMSAVGKGEAPRPEGSIPKLFWSNYNQWLVQTAQEIAGPCGQLAPDEFGGLSYHYLRSRGNSIEAGTNEVLKNTVASRVLGLSKSY